MRDRANEPRSEEGSIIKDLEVVLVAFSEEELHVLSRAFAAAGWRTHACPGPSSVACPLIGSDQPCDLRARVDAAVVQISPDHKLSHGQLPIATCAGCGASPGVIVLQRNLEDVEIEGNTAIIGGAGGPEKVVAAAQSFTQSSSAVST